QSRYHYRGPQTENRQEIMIATKLRMKLTVEAKKESGEISAVYFLIRAGKSATVREFAGGNVFADYDSNGRLLGIELIGPCDIDLLKRIARKEPQPIRKFVQQSIPR